MARSSSFGWKALFLAVFGGRWLIHITMNDLESLFQWFIIVLLLLSWSLPQLVHAQAVKEVVKITAETKNGAEGVDLTTNAFAWELKTGLIFLTGNTSSISANGTTELTYRVKRFENNIKAGAYYHRVERSTIGNTGTFSRYIYGFYRADYYLWPRTTLFASGGGYSDEIKGIEVAGTAFGGLSHYLLYRKRVTLRGSVGYHFTHEDRVAPAVSDNIHSLSAAVEYKYQLNDRLMLKDKLEVQENVEQRDDIRFTNDAEIQVKLHKHLALSVGVQIRFDNAPVTGFKKIDTLNTLGLAVTF